MPENAPESEQGQSEPRRSYRWPRYVWGAVLLGILIAIWAVRKEARRVHEMRTQDELPAATEKVTIPQRR